MAILNIVNYIPYEGFPYLWVNGKEFHWNGYFGNMLDGRRDARGFGNNKNPLAFFILLQVNPTFLLSASF